jgi:hypothetical protein
MKIKLMALITLLVCEASVWAESFIIDKPLKRGELTALCLPFSVNSSELGELFLPGGIADNVVSLYPVDSVAAGTPFVVRAKANRNSIEADSLDVVTLTATEFALPWMGGAVKSNPDEFTWKHIDVDGDSIDADALMYNVLDPLNMQFDVTIENLAVRRFLSQVTYERETPSQVQFYDTIPPLQRDIPNPVFIPVPKNKARFITVVALDEKNMAQRYIQNLPSGSTEAYIYNLLPNRKYHFQVMGDGQTLTKGIFFTTGQLRMLYVPGMFNTRDLGGWTCLDGRVVRYGKLYRGCELNGRHIVEPTDIEELKALGIAAEIDMRSHHYEEGAGVSAFGFLDNSQVDGDDYPTYLYTEDSGYELRSLTSYAYQRRWQKEFQFIVENLRRNRPIYFHCTWGCDRTGMLSLMLEGLLGMGYDAMMKDYELSSFHSLRTKDMRDDVMAYFDKQAGNTLQEKITTYFLTKLNIQKADIDFFLSEMLEGEAINVGVKAPSVNSPSITFYDLLGRPCNKPLRKGIYIRRK